jgi:hypothetical protein
VRLLVLLTVSLILFTQNSASALGGWYFQSSQTTHLGLVYASTSSDLGHSQGGSSAQIEAIDSGERKSEWQAKYLDVPQNAKIAIRRALDIWSMNFKSSVPITVEVDWSADLNEEVLSSARPGKFFNNFPGAPDSRLWYPSALANSLAKKDLDTKQSEIFLYINSSQSWHFGLDSNPSPAEFDLVSVVLHEIAHGLGFLSNANYENYFGTGYISQPSVFDGFLQIPDGRTFADFCNRSSELGKSMLSPLVWAGLNGTTSNDGKPIKLFSPPQFEPGTSITHIDVESLVRPLENGLLNPFNKAGEVSRIVGPVILGMLEDMRNSRQSNESLKPPNTPINLRAIVGDKYAMLTFDSPPCEGSTQTNSFIVTTLPGGKIQEFKSTPIKITGLQNGRSYKFLIQAKNSKGISKAVESNVVKPEVTPAFQIIDRGANVENFAISKFQGIPVLLYGDKRNLTLKMARLDGADWRLSVIRRNIDVGDISICTSSSKKGGVLHVLYGEKQSGDLIHSSLLGSKWTHEIVDGNGKQAETYSERILVRTNSNVSVSNTCVITNNQLQVFYRDDTKGLLLGATRTKSGWVYEVIDGHLNTDGRTTGDVGYDLSATSVNGTVHLIYDSVVALNSSSLPIQGEVRLASRKSLFPEDWKFVTLDGPENAKAVAGFSVSSHRTSGDTNFAWLSSSGDDISRADKLVTSRNSLVSRLRIYSSGVYGDFSGPLAFSKAGIVYGCLSRLCEISLNGDEVRLISGKQNFGKTGFVLEISNKEFVFSTLKGKIGSLSLS